MINYYLSIDSLIRYSDDVHTDDIAYKMLDLLELMEDLEDRNFYERL